MNPSGRAISNKCWLRLQRGPSPPYSLVVIATIRAAYAAYSLSGILYDHVETGRFIKTSPQPIMIAGIPTEP
jgi:hypothetical protein